MSLFKSIKEGYRSSGFRLPRLMETIVFSELNKEEDKFIARWLKRDEECKKLQGPRAKECDAENFKMLIDWINSNDRINRMAPYFRDELEKFAEK